MSCGECFKQCDPVRESDLERALRELRDASRRVALTFWVPVEDGPEPWYALEDALRTADRILGRDNKSLTV
jgi:hypothetical protein